MLHFGCKWVAHPLYFQFKIRVGHHCVCLTQTEFSIVVLHLKEAQVVWLCPAIESGRVLYWKLGVCLSPTQSVLPWSSSPITIAFFSTGQICSREHIYMCVFVVVWNHPSCCTVFSNTPLSSDSPQRTFPIVWKCPFESRRRLAREAKGTWEVQGEGVYWLCPLTSWPRSRLWTYI